MSKKFFVAGIVLYPDIYPCFDTFVLPKEVKKSCKKFGGKEKSSTFAIPFGKRVGESDSGSGFPGEIRRSLTRLETQYRSTAANRTRVDSEARAGPGGRACAGQMSDARRQEN